MSLSTQWAGRKGHFADSKFLSLNLARRWTISPEKGAETIVYLASSPKIAATTGRYFYKCRPIAPSAGGAGRTALSLWERSAALAGLNA
jgi:hypothetical protein